MKIFNVNIERLLGRYYIIVKHKNMHTWHGLQIDIHNLQIRVVQPCAVILISATAKWLISLEHNSFMNTKHALNKYFLHKYNEITSI